MSANTLERDACSVTTRRNTGERLNEYLCSSNMAALKHLVSKHN
jgi:hypothetical protein